MITLTATINLLTGENGTLGGVSSNFGGNNISAEISRVLGAKKQATNHFIIGASRLGDGSTLSGKVDYYIGKERSDSEGNFAVPYSFTIYGMNITSLSLSFDTYNNRHPHKITVNGVEYTDDDPVFTLGNLSGNPLYITIDNWNEPNYPLVLTGVYLDITIQVNRRNLISLESKIFERADISRPSFGIYSNSGNLTFNDWTGEIRDYAEQNLLVSDAPVMLYINNTLVKSVEPVKIAQFETETWDYNEDNRVVSVSLRDDLEEWQEITIEGFAYTPEKPRQMTGKDYYNYLYDKTPVKYNMVSFEELDEDTRGTLEIIVVNYPLLNDGTLWQSWTKLCTLSCSYIYKSPFGRTTFVHYWG